MGNRTSMQIFGMAMLSTTYGYNTKGQLTSVAENGHTTTYWYDTYSRSLGFTVKKGTAAVKSTTYTYNLADMLTKQDNAVNGTIKESYTRTYYSDGNVLQEKQTKSPATTTNYTYDGMGRLKTENTTTYTYDKFGNRATKNENGVITSYNYDANNRLTSDSNGSYSYDDNGNLLSRPGMAFTYDSFDRMIQAGNTTYTYDGNGLMQSRNDTQFTYDGTNIVAEKTGAATTTYARGLGLISTTTTGSNTLYYNTNPHGDVTMLTTHSGTTAPQSFTYDAFGNQTTATGTNNMRYNSEYYDQDSGLTYLRNRWLDSSIGRFTQADTYWNINNMLCDSNGNPSLAAVLQSSNLYAYCLQNPINLIDPTGNYARSAAVAYAQQYGNAGWFSGKRNDEYYNYRTNCANFVSQCVFAGGIKMNSSWSSKRADKGMLIPAVWNNNNYMWSVAEPWRLASKQFAYFSDKSNGYMNGDVLTIEKSDQVKNAANNWGIQAGDLLYLAGKDGTNIHHAMIVTEVANGEIYYAGNTNEAAHKELSMYMGNEQVKVIRIRDEAVLGYKL